MWAAAVDDETKTADVQKVLEFPVAHSVSREQAEAIGAWWDVKRAFVQPSEFILDGAGRVVSATYSSGPIGRLDAADVLALVGFLKSRDQKKEAG